MDFDEDAVKIQNGYWETTATICGQARAQNRSRLMFQFPVDAFVPVSY